MIRAGSSLLHRSWVVPGALLLASLLGGAAHAAGETSVRRGPAAEAPVRKGAIIEKVRVEGLKRIEEPAVLAKVSSQPGQLVDSDRVRKDIQAIFAMGFFEDIAVSTREVDAARVELVISVRERPVIAEVAFEGNEKIKTEDLREVIRLKDWAILDINKVKADVADRPDRKSTRLNSSHV